MNIQDALDLSLNEEAFRIIGKRYVSSLINYGLELIGTNAQEKSP